MSVHNENFDFTKVDPSDRHAFRGPVRKVLLPTGSRLYRFVSLPDPGGVGFRGNGLFERPWWAPHSTFEELSKLATRTKKSLTEVARSRLAVRPPWNPAMDTLAIIELRAPVYGWAGATAPQPIDEDRSVMLLGHFEQVYVPNLADDSSGVASRFAQLMYYGSM